MHNFATENSDYQLLDAMHICSTQLYATISTCQRVLTSLDVCAAKI